jgi:WD40 repeat protein
VSVWDTATGKELTILRGPVRSHSMAFSPDGRQLVAATLDQGVYLWDLAGAGRAVAAAPERAQFSALAVSPDGRTVAALCDPTGENTGGDRHTELILWDWPTGRERLRRAVPELWTGWAPVGIGGLQFSPDGRRLALTGTTGGVARALSVWDVERGEEVLTRRFDRPCEPVAPCTPPSEVLGARFTGDGRLLAYVVTRTSGVKEAPRYALAVRDADREEPVWSLAAEHGIGPLVVSPDGRLAAVPGDTVRGRGPAAALQVWDVAAGRLLWGLPSVPGWKDCEVVFSPDGRRLLTVPLGGAGATAEVWRRQAVVWDAASGQVVCAFEPPTVNAPFGPRRSRFVFAADGRRLASFGGVPGVKIWDAADGRELLTVGGPGAVAGAAFSPDGWLVALGQDGAITAWDGRATAGPWQPPAAALELVQQARTLTDDPTRAVELARQAVRAYPNRPTFWTALGQVQCRAGDAQNAVAALEKALAYGAGADEGVCCFTLALAHGRLGHSEAAREWFDRGERWLRALADGPRTEPVREQTRRARAEAAPLVGGTP